MEPFEVVEPDYIAARIEALHDLLLSLPSVRDKEARRLIIACADAVVAGLAPAGEKPALIPFVKASK